MTEENTPDVQPATEIETPAEQVVATAEVTDAPDTASDKEEKLLAGKFKSVEDLEKSYQELQSEFTRTRQAERVTDEQVPEYVPSPVETDLSQYNEEDVRVIQNLAQQALVKEKIADFYDRHGDELRKDSLLAAAVERKMRNMASRGTRINPDIAYNQAKSELEERLQIKTQVAKEEGLQEGKQIAKTKEQLGAVGETSRVEEVSDDQLSATELKKKYNIPVLN